MKNTKRLRLIKNQICLISINLFYLSKEKSEDLIYFVEDDYIHEKISLSEILYTYERLSSILGSDLIVCPTDYPYLYTQSEIQKIFLGEKRHWRQIDQTLCTLLTSNKIIQKYWNELTSMCKIEHYPFEKPLHNIYKRTLHFANSIFGGAFY